MACNSCGGRGQILRVERVSANSRGSAPRIAPKKLPVQKVTARTVTSIKPANDLDKHRA